MTTATVNRARGALTSAVTALALTTLTACSDGEQSAEAQIPAGRLCRGTLSDDAVNAVQLLTAAKEFAPINAEAQPATTAQDLVADYLADGTGGETHQLCAVHLPGRATSQIDIDVTLEDAEGVGDSRFANTFKQYDLGREGLASPQKAVLYAECVSEKFRGSPVMLRAALRNRHEPDGNPERLRRANLTLLHSVTLALVKELGCTARADLPETPELG
ncbi:hypothetical protein [Streptomyces liangshanensis]|uniref:Lipoprotein n=1 Tax=Streptomyces liangshanensis TaxID=2717324 RepID=A0A6G9H2A6_9ACTN|nr:hypothetical protein [Streptomyces liangshanensis]QIQ04600.1 hypothetical protein HA039_21980 [Streptomyces liangshanensis]